MARSTLVLVLAVLALGGSAAFAASSVIEGRVVNAHDGSPIGGAFVIADWYVVGSDGVGSRSSCLHVEVAKSDKDGRYVIPLDRQSPEPMINTYKAGMENFYEKATMTREEAAKDRQLQKMVPFTGTADQRRESLTWMLSLTSCGNRDLVAMLTPLYEAIDKETSQLQVTDPKTNPPNWFIRSLHWSTTGEEMPHRGQK